MSRVGIGALALGALIWLSSPLLAQQVFLSPASIVFDDRTRSAQLIVANTANETTVFRLEPTFFRMDEGGRLHEVRNEHPSNSAHEMLRFSPRQFELGPGESQLVRLAVRKPANLASGEYRLHLRVTNIGHALERPQAPSGRAGGDATSVQINLTVSRAVRILVRHQLAAARSDLASVAATRSGDAIDVSFEVRKSGAGSAQGAYSIVARRGSEDVVIAEGGVSIYAELETRRVSRAVPADAVSGSSALCVLYEDSASGQGDSRGERCLDIRSL